MPPLTTINNTDSFSLLAGWFIDGTGNPIQENILLESSGGMIVSIRKAEGYENDRNDLIDCSDHTIMPMLVDSHVHLALTGTENLETRNDQINASYHNAKKLISEHLDKHLKHGIIAVRDGGDRAGHTLLYGKEFKGSIAVNTSLAGNAWYAHGRYGDFIGKIPLRSLSESILRDTPKPDHVKIINSGINNLKYFGKETEPQFGYTELRKAIQTCNKLGLKTMIHANGKRAVEMSLKAGCDSIEHGFLMGKDSLKTMAEKGITWVPTLSPMKAYSQFLPRGSTESDNASRYLDHQLEQVHTAHQYGVTIAVGTDAGSFGVHHGQAVNEEMRLLVSAGLPFEDSVRCASTNGAKLIGLENEIGRLTTGAPSTFLFLEGRPENFFDSPIPKMIFIKGKISNFSTTE